MCCLHPVVFSRFCSQRRSIPPRRANLALHHIKPRAARGPAHLLPPDLHPMRSCLPAPRNRATWSLATTTEMTSQASPILQSRVFAHRSDILLTPHRLPPIWRGILEHVLQVALRAPRHHRVLDHRHGRPARVGTVHALKCRRNAGQIHRSRIR